MSTTEESKPPSLSVLARGSDMITIDVGPEHQKYKVYTELISYYSEYFKGTLNGPWKEAEDRVIELPDIEPQVFDVFIDWLYTQKVPQKNRDWIEPNDELKSNSTEHVQKVELLIIKSYVFADRFLVPHFRVAIFNYFAGFLTKDSIPPYYEMIIYAFDNLPSTSAMLTLLVRLHCAFWDESCDTADNGELKLRQELPYDFLLRAMIQSSKFKDKEKAKNMTCCECHKSTVSTGREGCDTCMPLPEVKEEAQPEAEAQADGTPADGEAQADANAQGEAAQDNQDDGEAAQNGGQDAQNDPANPADAAAAQDGQANQGDAEAVPVDQANQGDAEAAPADQANQEDTEAAPADQANQNAENTIPDTQENQGGGEADLGNTADVPVNEATAPVEGVAPSSQADGNTQGDRPAQSNEGTPPVEGTVAPTERTASENEAGPSQVNEEPQSNIEPTTTGANIPIMPAEAPINETPPVTTTTQTAVAVA